MWETYRGFEREKERASSREKQWGIWKERERDPESENEWASWGNKKAA